MPKLNKIIVRSIVQDLKSLDKICNELRKHVQNSQIMSWRYPPQMCHCININFILNEYNGSSYEWYLLVLELMYDRFQYFLHLIIKYLDMVPFVPQLHSPRNVLRPEYLSTGASLNMLWDRFQTLQKYYLDFVICNTRDRNESDKNNVTLSLGAVLSQSISVSEPTFHQHFSFNRNVQTEICSLLKCESCCLSEEIVKFFINEVQTQCTECEIQSLISCKCDRIKQEIFHNTQWGAMMNWSNAVQNDINEIFQLLTMTVRNNKKLQESLETREQRIGEACEQKDTEIQKLKEDIKYLQVLLKTEKSKNSNLKNEKIELDSELKNEEKTVKQLYKKLQLSESSWNEVSHQNTILEAELKNIATEFGVQISSPEECKNILINWRSILKTKESEYNNLKNELQTLSNKLQENENMFQVELEKKEATIKEEKEKQNTMTSELSKMNEYVSECQCFKQHNEQLQINLQEAEERRISLSNTIDQLRKELEQCRIQEKILLENPDISTKIGINVQGDPEQDMENQIQANEIRIHMLSQQTTKLKETLKKFRRLKQMHQKVV